MKTLLVLCSLLIATVTAHSREMRYTVDLRNTASHTVHVQLQPVGYSSGTATFQMPVWAPGAYSVSHYGRFVTNFKAVDPRGRTLPVTRLNDDRWEIKAGSKPVTISYDVLDSHKDSTSLYFAMANMDTSLFFANATALFGYYDDDKSSPATVTYEKPSDWKLTCALPPSAKGYVQDLDPTFQNTTFYASDYDALADAPIMASPGMLTRSFRDGSAVYDVALSSDGTFEIDSLTTYIRKIVHAETDFFHDTPFQHYTFVIYAPTMAHIPSFAQGALEHMNSSDYLLMNLRWPAFKSNFLSIFSHEFFHLWDVKRIHSNKLGPFDYTHRVMTTSLWMAEGITEYYAHTLLARYGIERPDAFYQNVQQWVQEMKRAPASQSESLEQLSIDESDFHLDNAELFYIKGPLVGLMLDLEIRNRTNNAKSLDDVMFALNADAKQGKTFSDEELIHKVEQYAGVDLTDFYNKYIHGIDSLPLDHYLSMMGVTVAANGGAQTQLGMTSDSKLFFQSVDTTGALGRAGIRAGDVLVALNGTKLTLDNIDLFVNVKDQPSATLTVERDGKSMDVPINFAENQSSGHHRVGTIDVDLNATPTQTAIRKGVLGENA